MLRAPRVCTLSYLPIEGTREFNRATRRYFPLVPLCSLWLCMSSCSLQPAAFETVGVYRTHTALELEVVSINPHPKSHVHINHNIMPNAVHDEMPPRTAGNALACRALFPSTFQCTLVRGRSPEQRPLTA